MNPNAYAHPSIMCAQWEGWDGTPVREPPLFYTGLSELAADILSNASDEVLHLSKVVNEKSGVDTSQVIMDIFLRVYLNFNSQCFSKISMKLLRNCLVPVIFPKWNTVTG